MRLNYVIVFVSDMGRSVAFYRDTLELPLRFESPVWSEFATDGARLALPQSGPARVDTAGTKEQAGRGRPGLQVADLDAFHRRMTEHQVLCVQEPKSVFGARLAQYLGPDGLAISVSEARPGG